VNLKDFDWATSTSYLFVGVSSIFFALFVSSQFVTPSSSQTNQNMGAAQNLKKAAVPNSDYLNDKNYIQTFLEPFIYDVDGRRDPFVPFNEQGAIVGDNVNSVLLPLQRFELSEIRLVGIIWNIRMPKAMFIDPNKRIHILKKDDRIGRRNGYLAAIREGEVVIVETVNKGEGLTYTSQILRLER